LVFGEFLNREKNKGAGGSMSLVTGRVLTPVFFAATALLVSALPAAAQQSDLSSLLPGSSGVTSARIIQLILAVTVLSVAPGLLVW
jgi:hypothetical protein